MLRTPHHLLVLLTALVAFVVTFVGGTQEAVAAPIGMCGDTAQSIAAPPPMFEANGATLKACDEHQELQLLDGQPPAKRVTSSVEVPDQDVVLSTSVKTRRSKTYRIALIFGTDPLPSEHRWRGLRPPQL